MASTTGRGHGGRRENSGRKRKFGDGRETRKEWQRCHRRIYLEKNIFQSWLQAKFISGYEARSDSAFAAYLLSQDLRRTSSVEVSRDPSSSSFHRRRKASYPRKHVSKQTAESEGTQTSTLAKPSDQPAVVESTIAGPDIQRESTSLNENSNPTNLTTPHEETKTTQLITNAQYRGNRIPAALSAMTI